MKPHLFPNTLYGETEDPVPVIESPLSAAQSLQDMLLQSWGGTLRPFPAMPDAWRDAVFHNLSAEGGFLVSARYAGGRTQWVRVESKAGQPVNILPGWVGPLHTDASPQKVIALEDQPGRYALHLERGESVFLWPDDAVMPFEVSPIPADTASDRPAFGLP